MQLHVGMDCACNYIAKAANLASFAVKINLQHQSFTSTMTKIVLPSLPLSTSRQLCDDANTIAIKVLSPPYASALCSSNRGGRETTERTMTENNGINRIRGKQLQQQQHDDDNAAIVTDKEDYKC
jgi:hypothetical protein